MEKKISVIWKKSGMAGNLEIFNAGSLSCEKFVLKADENRLDFSVSGAKLEQGAFGTIVTVRAENSFSFFVRDVKAKRPIYIREYDVVVTVGEDQRSYDDIVEAIAKNGLIRELDRFELEPEENFENAAAKTKNMRVPTWLGLARDIRMFEVAPHAVVNDSALWDSIVPMYHHSRINYEEMGDAQIRFDYFAGRGIGVQYKVRRWLENRVLPILNVLDEDGGIRYEQKMFVTNEVSPLTEENVHGTHYLISDKYAVAPSVRTPEQQEETDRIHDSEMFREEESVIYLRVEAVNEDKVPRYAYMRLPQPNVDSIPERKIHPVMFEGGCNYFSKTGRVFMTATLNGKPFSEVESALLLEPGEKAVYICKIPHMPISRERAEALLQTDYDEKLAECVKYWTDKLENIADIHLPEKRIEEMMKAGFLHLDLVCFGNNPDDAVAPVVGVYTPIGTESTPIIQYLESVGDTKLAERSIMYFIKKQRPDGFMQNFQTYMSETGCGLWNAAEHFKYTHDIEWLKSIKDNLIRGFEYIKEWAEGSRDEKLRNRGYGLIYGKVSDCEHPFHSYMLNSTTYGGLRSVADAMAYIDEAEAKRIGDFAEELKQNILDSMKESFAVGPVVPLSDGTWCPTASIWPEHNMLGLRSLFAKGGTWYTHGAMVEKNPGGGIYMVTNNVLEPESVYVSFINNVFAELLAIDNVGFSQPYYSVHPYAHINLGQVGAYLKEFYNDMSALADRETYTFWEHLYQVSPHKTHEEGWFLMRCRWMLYMDEYGKFQIFGAIPRAWMEDGKEISFSGMKSRYGKLSVKAVSNVANGVIKAAIKLESNGFAVPEKISIRLPHPNGRKAIGVVGGEYCPDGECVYISGFDGEAEVELRF
ncbi:MAG: hypothetical protein E7487_10110 [Ruminococcaceae bacterium]|nr:hypothetical protein [Oscillospiraceae bacterium]